jgi:hypothetical protein
MEKAIGLTDWFLSGMRRVYEMFRGEEQPVDRDAEAILATLGKKGELTERELSRNLTRFKGRENDLSEKLKSLVFEKKIRRKPTAKTEYFSLLTAPTLTLTPINAEKNDTSVSVGDVGDVGEEENEKHVPVE